MILLENIATKIVMICTFEPLGFIVCALRCELSAPQGAPLQSKMVYVVVKFFQYIFICPLLLGIVMYANGFKTKENQKLTEIKN